MFAVTVLLSCTHADPSPDPASPTAQTGTPSTSTPTTTADPFAAQPDPASGLTDVSADLDALLEHGDLVGACDRWRAAPDDRQLELLCGKSMFFYEGFDTLGIPAVLFDFLFQHFPDELGPGYSELGLVVHPNSPEGRPIGFAPGTPLGSADTLALTCAACHFGQLPDGRYAVGAPNHDYQYGRHMLAITLAPMAASPGFQEADHHPDAIAAVRPLLDRFDADPGLALQLGLAMLPLLGDLGDAPALTWDQEGQYASWKPGTMDFMITPLPLDDGVHTVSKILPLWGIPDAAEEQAAGMPNAMLAWTGAAPSLDAFLQGFVAVGGGEHPWTEDDLAPLREYILSLRPPSPPPVDADAVAHGEQVFWDAGCGDCHQGPRGSGLQVYDFDEIGTDDALRDWGDGPTCCDFEGTVLTHGVKSPRLVGLWAQARFLHNGSVDTLQALLCEPDRPTVDTPVLSDDGHRYGCDLPASDRQDLVSYLSAH
ncbi:MAG: hypothetical protein R3F59_36920 [Myxococcota bacterium]